MNYRMRWEMDLMAASGLVACANCACSDYPELMVLTQDECLCEACHAQLYSNHDDHDND